MLTARFQAREDASNQVTIGFDFGASFLNQSKSSVKQSRCDPSIFSKIKRTCFNRHLQVFYTGPSDKRDNCRNERQPQANHYHHKVNLLRQRRLCGPGARRSAETGFFIRE